MGGGGQANSGQASQAAGQQTAADQQQMKIAGQNAATQKRMVDMLFGSGSPGSSGTLSQFLDPKSLNNPNFNDAYKTQWNQAQNNIAQNYQQQRGQLAQGWANSGMSSNNTPSGFQADQMRKLGSSEADTRGATYAGLKGSQYSDALNNFWNASNVASGNAATAGQTATQNLGNAGSSSAQIYGTAGQYHPSATAGVLGSALGAAGQVGGGMAMHCPRAGSLILMTDGSEKKVENLIPGDLIAGGDGKPCIVELVNAYHETALRIVTSDDCALDVSSSHALMTPEGGFVIAFESIGRMVVTKFGAGKVIGVTFIGKLPVYDILTDGSHSYRANGIWGWGVRDVASDAYLEKTENYEKLLKLAV